MMFACCTCAVIKLSDNGMPKHTVGLTLSYSF